jgi:hypothetical protein
VYGREVDGGELVAGPTSGAGVVLELAVDRGHDQVVAVPGRRGPSDRPDGAVV